MRLSKAIPGLPSGALGKNLTRLFTTTNIKVSRREFAQVESKDIEYFKQVINGEGGAILTDKEDVQPYNTDWMRKFSGYSQTVVRPKTTTQVAKVLEYCNDRNLAVVPQGGNTGLVGGSVPVFDEIVLSTGLMNKLESFDTTSGVVVCQAGVILETLDKHVGEHGFTVPLDLGAKGSCQIGGNVATNAGGIRLLRYGSLHGNVLGLEVVLADGTIIDGISTLRKDNTGYDLKQLFIGAEGSLGIITKVALLVPPRPTSVNVAFFGCRDFDAVKAALKKAKTELCEILSAFEFLDRSSLDCVLAHSTGSRDPLQEAYPFYVLVETSGSNKDHDQEKLNKYLENVLGENIVADGVLAESGSQAIDIWKLRESIPESLQRAGAVYKYDISLPLTHFYSMVEIMRDRLHGKARVMGYGHVGDGNLHLNISAPEYSADIYNLIEPFVYEFTSKYRGSISAEHGLGLMKAPHLHYSKSAAAIEIMNKMKKMLDPKGILNPYKFPQT